MAEVKTFRCDYPSCGKTSEKVNLAIVSYMRTEEEIKQLNDAQKLEIAERGIEGTPFPTMQDTARTSIVTKELDLCDEHYVAIKAFVA